MKLLQQFFRNGLPWFDKKKSTSTANKECSPDGNAAPLSVKYQAPSDHVTDDYASVTLAVTSTNYDSNSRYWSANDSYLDVFSRSSLIRSNHCSYPSPEFTSSDVSFKSSSSSLQCSHDGHSAGHTADWRTMDASESCRQSRRETQLTGGGSDSCDSGVLIDMLTRSESTDTLTTTRQAACGHGHGHGLDLGLGLGKATVTVDQSHHCSRPSFACNMNDIADNTDNDSFSDELLSNVFPMLDDEDGRPMQRTVNEISSSLAANVARLRRDKRAVEDTFSKARSEERLKARELARIRRQVCDARRDILLGTLKELKKELDRQCLRLQAAYDTVLTVRWRQLHTVEQTSSTGTFDIHRKTAMTDDGVGPLQ